MSSEYRIHRPYVLATLPRPLAHTEGNILAREVYGLRDGQKMKKRSELAVGIDGESASIYDIPTSRLITSYPIPPQESFTCPPYSIRVRHPDSSDVYRYTFIATRDPTSHKLTLFKDVVRPGGKTSSTSVTQALKKSPVRYISCSTGKPNSASVGDILVVCQDGEITCLSGETLVVQWLALTKSAVQDASAQTIDGFEIDYAVSTTAEELIGGIFRTRPEILGALHRTLGSSPELIVMVSRSVSQGAQSLHLVVLAALSGTSSELQRLVPLDVVPIPSTTNESTTAVYQVDARAGFLLRLDQGTMTAFELTGTIPKAKSIVEMDDAETFTRLSRPFVLSCSSNSIGLYNYQYRSIHARSALDLSELPADCQEPQSCRLVSYLASQDLAVALIDNVLVSIQVEPPKVHGKSRKQGRLIDSIGRGAGLEISAKKPRRGRVPREFSQKVPGTITAAYLAKYHAKTAAAEELLSNNDVAAWEELLRQEFAIDIPQKSEMPNENGTDSVNGANSGNGTEEQQVPEWCWLPDSSAYPTVDRRWVIYAISRVFSVEPTTSDGGRPGLRLILPDSNVTTYLTLSGRLTLSNVHAAFREEDLGAEAVDKNLASDLIHCLTEADPSTTLLLNYLQATKLGEVEILLVIRALMLSMDLIPDTERLRMKQLMTEPHHDPDTDMDLDELEREIAVTEHHLGDDSSSRSRGLTLAFTKLWRLPAVATVKALRTALQMEEVLALVYLLRVELVRGAWTTLYVDPTSFDAEGNEPPPDGVIALIADLLGRCLDAVGSGGWLFNDATCWADRSEANDFLTGLKLEVAAALEGIQADVYLKSIVGEAERFGLATQKSGAGRVARNGGISTAPMALEDRGTRLLPLGLRPRQQPARNKVVAGGEVVQRSSRETGHLISQKVEVYSLEKLVV